MTKEQKEILLLYANCDAWNQKWLYEMLKYCAANSSNSHKEHPQLTIVASKKKMNSKSSSHREPVARRPILRSV